MTLEFDLLLVNTCGFVCPLRANPFTHSSFKPYGFYHVYFLKLDSQEKKAKLRKEELLG